MLSLTGISNKIDKEEGGADMGAWAGVGSNEAGIGGISA